MPRGRARGTERQHNLAAAEIASRHVMPRVKRCRDCGIMIGPGHIETEEIAGRCSACHRWWQRLEELKRGGNAPRTA